MRAARRGASIDPRNFTIDSCRFVKQLGNLLDQPTRFHELRRRLVAELLDASPVSFPPRITFSRLDSPQGRGHQRRIIGRIFSGRSNCATAHAVDLASHTGLRLGDLLRLSWSHVGADAIVIATGKSKHRREAIVPLYDGLKAVLASIPKRSTTILTNSRQRPWTRDGFGSSFNKAKIAAGMSDGDLHFHDLRGTAATRFYVAGLPERVVAEIMGWEEDHVARIIRRYVDRTAATKAIIRQLNEKRT